MRSNKIIQRGRKTRNSNKQMNIIKLYYMNIIYIGKNHNQTP
jgi:hypothetical protein